MSIPRNGKGFRRDARRDVLGTRHPLCHGHARLGLLRGNDVNEKIKEALVDGLSIAVSLVCAGVMVYLLFIVVRVHE